LAQGWELKQIDLEVGDIAPLRVAGKKISESLCGLPLAVAGRIWVVAEGAGTACRLFALVAGARGFSVAAQYALLW
jgi:hypothetical protein